MEDPINNLIQLATKMKENLEANEIRRQEQQRLWCREQQRLFDIIMDQMREQARIYDEPEMEFENESHSLIQQEVDSIPDKEFEEMPKSNKEDTMSDFRQYGGSSSSSVFQQGISLQSVSSQSIHFDIEIVDNISVVDEIEVVEIHKVKSLNSRTRSTRNSTDICAHKVFGEMPRGIEIVNSQPECDDHICAVRVTRWQQKEPDVLYTSPLDNSIEKFTAKGLLDCCAHNMLEVMSSGGIRKKLSENLENIGEYASNCGIMTFKVLDSPGFLVQLMKVSGGLSILTKESSGGRKIHKIKDLSIVFDRGKLGLAVLGIAIMVFDPGGRQGVSNCHAIGNLEVIGVKVLDSTNVYTRHDIADCYHGVLDDPWFKYSLMVGMLVVTVRPMETFDANYIVYTVEATIKMVDLSCFTTSILLGLMLLWYPMESFEERTGMYATQGRFQVSLALGSRLVEGWCSMAEGRLDLLLDDRRLYSYNKPMLMIDLKFLESYFSSQLVDMVKLFVIEHNWIWNTGLFDLGCWCTQNRMWELDVYVEARGVVFDTLGLIWIHVKVSRVITFFNVNPTLRARLFGEGSSMVGSKVIDHTTRRYKKRVYYMTRKRNYITIRGMGVLCAKRKLSCTNSSKREPWQQLGGAYCISWCPKTCHFLLL